MLVIRVGVCACVCVCGGLEVQRCALVPKHKNSTQHAEHRRDMVLHARTTQPVVFGKSLRLRVPPEYAKATLGVHHVHTSIHTYAKTQCNVFIVGLTAARTAPLHVASFT